MCAFVARLNEEVYDEKIYEGVLSIPKLDEGGGKVIQICALFCQILLNVDSPPHSIDEMNTNRNVNLLNLNKKNMANTSLKHVVF